MFAFCYNTLTNRASHALLGNDVNWSCQYIYKENLTGFNLEAYVTTMLSTEIGSDRVIDKKLGCVYKFDETYADLDEEDNIVHKKLTSEVLKNLEWNNLDYAHAEHNMCCFTNKWNSFLTIVFETETKDHPVFLTLTKVGTC
jgi:hypothetical protein